MFKSKWWRKYFPEYYNQQGNTDFIQALKKASSVRYNESILWS